MLFTSRFVVCKSCIKPALSEYHLLNIQLLSCINFFFVTSYLLMTFLKEKFDRSWRLSQSTFQQQLWLNIHQIRPHVSFSCLSLDLGLLLYLERPGVSADNGRATSQGEHQRRHLGNCSPPLYHNPTETHTRDRALGTLSISHNATGLHIFIFLLSSVWI